MPVNNKTYHPLGYVTFKAAEDLLPNRFIGFDGKTSSSESKSLGVTDSKWISDEYASAVTIGTVIIETSGAVTAGDAVTSDTGGKAKTATGIMPINGRAIDTTASAGFVRILLVP